MCTEFEQLSKWMVGDRLLSLESRMIHVLMDYIWRQYELTFSLIHVQLDTYLIIYRYEYILGFIYTHIFLCSVS